MVRRRVLIIGSVLAILACAGFYYVAQGACTDLLPIRETEGVLRLEASEFQRAASGEYEQNRGATGQPFGPLARPVRVLAISGKTATLAIEKRMDIANRAYAAAWRDVYRRHHGGADSCVRVRLVWDSTSDTQQCCRADI